MTSAVPSSGDGQVTAAESGRAVRIDTRDRTSTVADTKGTAYDLVPGRDGITYLDQQAGIATAHVVRPGESTAVAKGPLASVALQPGADGRVFVTGDVSGRGGSGVDVLPHTNAQDTVSSEGRLAVQPVLTPSVRSAVESIDRAGKDLSHAGKAEPDPSAPAAPQGGGSAGVTVTSTVTTTGRQVTEQVAPPSTSARASQGKVQSPALPGGGKARSDVAPHAASGTSNSTVDTDRWCAVPRNDPNTLALQPTPNQVEWAVDMAVRGDLSSQWLTQGGWRDQDDVGTVDPQSLFPLPALTGGGRIPAQVLLGIMAQESNLWQAEPGSVPGQTGNPLASFDGFYGRASAPEKSGGDYWAVDWTKSDCGYGVGQITDGMRLPAHPKPGETELPADVQRAVAVDYAVNIAAAAQFLAGKWNEIHQSGQTITVNDDNPAHIEDWFAAVWDYNAGLNPASQAGSNGNWGLGWYNNPANPLYDPARGPFLDGKITCTLPGNIEETGWTMCSQHGASNVTDNPTFADAAHPENWPYEEKVMGWAAESIDTGYSYDTDGNQDRAGSSGYSTMGFRPEWWDTDQDRIMVKPPLDTFCSTSANSCDPASPPPCEPQHLGSSCDTPHWWHQQNATWKPDCSTSCGHENLKYDTLRAEPGRGYNLLYGEPQCSGGLPSGAEIVTSVPDGTPTYSSCGNVSNDAGTFGFTFQPDAQGHYEARMDLSQIGGGWGGHFWYAHTRSDDTGVSNPGGTVTSSADSVIGPMSIVGSWKLSHPLNAWTRVLVHIPDTGAQTQQAIYTVHTGAGNDENRIINTHYDANTWVSLGVFHFVPLANGDFQGVTLSNYTSDGTGGDDVAWGAVAFQPLSAKPKDFVVQMGDSYSSGEGAEPYLPGTDVGPYASQDSQTSTGASWNACRRSQNSWIRQTVLPDQSSAIGALADSSDASLDYHSVACSGAYTWEMDPALGQAKNWGTIGEYHEVQQLSSGFLDSNTTLVALTIGGNDAGFSNTVQDCVEVPPGPGCPSDATVKGQIDSAVSATSQVIADIHSEAPNAKIVLLGYPHLFDTSTVCDSVVGATAMTQLNTWADYFTQQDNNAMATLHKSSGVPVVFEDPEPQFFKGYEDCGAKAAGINDFVAAPTGPGDFSCPVSVIHPKSWECASMESFHPNNTGTKRYALALQDALSK
ncbi:hypothetical protein K7472_27050 [Streptomyces sp. PTM05]|uniref:Golvesin/Xly CBD-like domain-containing protein n=1 Tax=Streptantibioticus parmotrematis TaxID=2873249 RepID=A0ABS7QZ31_9ACTN|nr:GDSL-type esterase/lipase family protein [Streptantibioticus parmotrematis]MBY8888472.1 hypothetical protein [Streptantibioticus parmotrematis]